MKGPRNMNTALSTTRLLFRYGTPDGMRWDTEIELSLSPEDFDRLREKHRARTEDSDVQPILSALNLRTEPDTSEVLKAFFGRGAITKSSTAAELDVAIEQFTPWKYFFAWLIIEHKDSLRVLIGDTACAGNENISPDELDALLRIRRAFSDGEYHDVITANEEETPEV